jgi:hypothetical protein
LAQSDRVLFIKQPELSSAFFFFFETVSCCVVSTVLELTVVAQAGLEHSVLLLPPPKCWYYRRAPSCLCFSWSRNVLQGARTLPRTLVLGLGKAQAVERLPSKREILSSNPELPKKKKEDFTRVGLRLLPPLPGLRFPSLSDLPLKNSL